MCGIFVHVSEKAFRNPHAKGLQRLRDRGPDFLKTHQIISERSTEPYYLTFCSSVLALRGNGVCEQPLVDPQTGSVLCWNGEAWSVAGQQVQNNDTQVVFNLLLRAAKNSSDASTSNEVALEHDKIVRALADIAGPWALVFYDNLSSTLYFGRDPLGRRSLLFEDNDIANGDLTLSSITAVASREPVREVPANYVHCLPLSESRLTIRTLSYETAPPEINRSLPSTAESVPHMPTENSVNDFQFQLLAALQPRVKDIPTYTALGSTDCPSRVAILFSGGIDCTLLARLTHDLLSPDQPIDLLNVAFENPRKSKNSASGTSSDVQYELCPDRVTGRSSFAELCATCPYRTWRFVSINVPYVEMLHHRSTIIQLMKPHNTEMDLSITMALYFAARGQGLAEISPVRDAQPTPYTTTARVLLSGLGADELFGGYSRHAAAFARNGYADLIDELSLDFERIGSRNLGRDDRVISHWGRETRYPFLDETFTKFALGLPVWEKCGFRVDKAITKYREDAPKEVAECIEDLDPAKMLLRCAAWNLGMKGVASEKKRAIQFGARTAKMHTGKSKGTDLVTDDLQSVNGSIPGSKTTSDSIAFS